MKRLTLTRKTFRIILSLQRPPHSSLMMSFPPLSKEARFITSKRSKAFPSNWSSMEERKTSKDSREA